MRNYTFTFLIILLLSFFSSNVLAKNSGSININSIRFEQQGDSLYIEVEFNLNNAEIKSNVSIDFVPILLSDHRIMELPKLSLKGRNSYRSHNRLLAINKKQGLGDATYDVIKLDRPTNQTISYRISIPYENWMADARVDLEKYVSSRGEENLISVRTIFNKKRKQVEQAERITPEYNIIAYTTYIVPEIEVVKKRNVSIETNLYFLVGSSKLDSYYKGNSDILKDIGEIINDIYFDKNVAITGLSLTGYASPEGRLTFNRNLSNARAKTLKEYLMLRYSISKDMYEIHYGGENWDGLKKMVELSSMNYKSDILVILNDVKNDSARKKILEEFEGGVAYRHMLKYMYPNLRKVIVRIDYQIKPFTLYQAQSIISQRPGDLSLNEMFLVANSYEKGSVEYFNVFEIAFNTYPDEEVAILNMANTALILNDLRNAEKYLSMVIPRQYITEFFNLKGALEILKGNYDEAERYFELSLTQAGIDAGINLIELKNIGISK